MRRGAVAAVAAVLLLAGCGSGSPETAEVAAQGSKGASDGAESSPTADGPGPSDRPDPALSGSPTPTRPPGDPGPGDPTPTESHDEKADAEVAESALVDAETLASVAGGSWTASSAPEDCTATVPAGSTASRAGAQSAEAGRLVQTVARYAVRGAATAAVPDVSATLVACGFTVTGDPRLGDASQELARGTGTGAERAMVLAAEGVTVVLVASGTAAAPGVWESLTDIALGSSCAAATHGCH